MKSIVEKERILLFCEDGTRAGFVTLPSVNSKVYNIDHIFVEPAHRGKGVASQLMELALAQLESQGRQVILTCPYAQKGLPQHPEWSHMPARDIRFSHH